MKACPLLPCRPITALTLTVTSPVLVHVSAVTCAIKSRPSHLLIQVHHYEAQKIVSFSAWSPNTSRMTMCPDTQSPSRVLSRMSRKQKPRISALEPPACPSPAPGFVLCPEPKHLEKLAPPFSRGLLPEEPSSPGTGRPSPLGCGSQTPHLPIPSSFAYGLSPFSLPGSLLEMILGKCHYFKPYKPTSIKSMDSNNQRLEP